MPRLKPLLAEIRRRHVARVAIVYVAVAWALVEGADVVFPNLGLPPETVTLVIALAIVGFPLALIAAWAYDVTPEGVVRTDAGTPDPGATATRGAGPRADEGDRPARETEASASRSPSIAVLPFADLSPERDQEYFAHGITEELLNALARVPGLRVPARTSCFAFKDRDEDIREIGKALGVDTVLAGSVRKAGERLRITVQLIEVRDGYHLWSERYDREIADVFAMQEEIASAVALKLGLALRDDAPRPLVTTATASLDAYRLYLKGRELYYRRGPPLRQGVDCFEEALEVDPTFAAAHAGLAEANSMLGHWGYARPRSVMPEAAERARRAVELDEGVAEGHCALGIVALLYEWDPPTAEREFRRALALHPRHVQAAVWYGLFYHIYVRQDYGAGLEHLKTAVEADPLSSYAFACHAHGLVTAGRLEEAADRADAAIQRDPTSYLSHFTRAVVCNRAGEHDAATDAAETALALSGRHWWALATLAMARAGAGCREEAEALCAEFTARERRETALPTWHAVAAVAAGDVDGALDQLERAARDRDPNLILALGGWAELEPLRGHERFQAVARRVLATSET